MIGQTGAFFKRQLCGSLGVLASPREKFLPSGDDSYGFLKPLAKSQRRQECEHPKLLVPFRSEVRIIHTGTHTLETRYTATSAIKFGIALILRLPARK